MGKRPNTVICWLEGIVGLGYIVDLFPSLATKELLLSQDYHYIEVLHSRGVGVWEYSKPTMGAEHSQMAMSCPAFSHENFIH